MSMFLTIFCVYSRRDWKSILIASSLHFGFKTGGGGGGGGGLLRIMFKVFSRKKMRKIRLIW
jgi:hypothetical protein